MHDFLVETNKNSHLLRLSSLLTNELLINDKFVVMRVEQRKAL